MSDGLTECPEGSLSDLGESLSKQIGNRRYPLNGTIELTQRCNLSCLHCYINQPACSQKAVAREMTFSQIRHVLDEVVGAGCLFMLFTGGEPLLREDFKDIWRYAKKKGLLLTLFTNGTLLDEKMADFLSQWRPRMVEITLYGATRETYEKVTGLPGSYKRCLNAIKLVLKHGMRLTLKSVLMKNNVHEFDQMKNYADRLGIDFRFDSILWPRQDGGQEPISHRLSPEEVVALDKRFPEREKELAELYQKHRSSPTRGKRVYSCGAGLKSFHIDNSGMLGLCMLTHQPRCDLGKKSFQDSWETIAKVLKTVRTKNTPCQTCMVGVLCAQCPAWSQTVHGDDETLVDYVCQIGKLRLKQIENSTVL